MHAATTCIYTNTAMINMQHVMYAHTCNDGKKEGERGGRGQREREREREEERERGRGGEGGRERGREGEMVT